MPIPSEQHDDPFLFGPDTEMWEINRERCGLIFGPAAAVLQIAHPRIAQGVADHSDFQSDTLGRLKRTLHSTNRIAFGRSSEAEAMRARLAAVHGRVRGTVSTGVPGASRYSAFEPDLLQWVLATLIMAAISGYELVYGPLPDSRKENFYRDMCRFGTYFGTDPQGMPDDWPAFEAYYSGLIEGDLLGSHPLCREMARAIIYPKESLRVRLLGSFTAFLPLETLPQQIRDRLGLRSTPLSRTQMRLARSLLPKVFPLLPSFLRYYPEYLQAGAPARGMREAPA